MSGQPFRLPDGGLVDRARPLDFRFNGRTLTGYAGDTLAAALLANGVHLVARSYRLHRPRGIYSAGEEEPCALVALGGDGDWTPNCRATRVPLLDGLEAASQLGWPSLRFDLGRWVDASHWLWPAGFYHKTFKWPRWRTWEPLVRHMAGLGHAPVRSRDERWDQVHLHCDLLVCGAGPAGLMAAREGLAAGLRVVLAEQDALAGGSLLCERARMDDTDGAGWATREAAALRSAGVRLLARTTVTGIHDGPVVTLAESSADGSREAVLWVVRPRHIVLATGAIEQGLVFPGNDRPGTLLAGAVRSYLNRHAVLAGRRIGIATGNDSAWQTAFDLAASGQQVAFIADTRAAVARELDDRARGLGIPVHLGAAPSRTFGNLRLRGVELTARDGVRRRLPCDALAVSGGWAPRVHLWRHARGELRFDPGLQCFLPTGPMDGVSVAGALAGTTTLGAALDSGAAAVRSLLGPRAGAQAMPVAPRIAAEPLPAREVRAQRLDLSGRRQWLDLLHDVTVDDAALAVREGYTPVEHFKRFTTTGMGADQGKTGNLNAFLALGELTARAPESVGVTTFRPPYMPVSLGALAGAATGEAHAPRRWLPAHRQHLGLGAVMADYGWQRPDAYPAAGETLLQATHREVLAVRNVAGVFDNSPIGKLEVRGPDAASFLDRLWTCEVASLRTGQARYGLLLDDQGVVLDDGIVGRLGEDHFLLNVGSAHARFVTEWLERWAQLDWPGLRVWIEDRTQQSACYTVAGPSAREVLAALSPRGATPVAALPHMHLAQASLAGFQVGVARVSFSGECSFELSVPADEGPALLAALLAAGAPFGLTPYGIEALMLLRLEKGYFQVGQDSDGSTSPDDLGWGTAARRKPAACVGRRSLDRAANTDPRRRQLVGVAPLDEGDPLRIGAHFSAGPGQGTQGWITSAAWSPSLRRWIGLGLLAGGRSRLGEVVPVYDAGWRGAVRITAPCAWDPQGARLHG